MTGALRLVQYNLHNQMWQLFFVFHTLRIKIPRRQGSLEHHRVHTSQDVRDLPKSQVMNTLVKPAFLSGQDHYQKARFQAPAVDDDNNNTCHCCFERLRPWAGYSSALLQLSELSDVC